MRFFFILFFFSFNNLVAFEKEYFLTLRNDKVNLRQGPSLDQQIKIFYKKKFLPVLIQEKSDNFRKIRDHENNSGWIHISQLSKKKAAINIDDLSILFSRPTMFSKPVARLEKGKLCLIKKCKNNWCNIVTQNYSGWIKNNDVWGKIN